MERADKLLLGIIGSLAVLSLTACSPNREAVESEPRRPHIVVILADDMGYGDVQAYNADSKIPTPNINRLAEQGMRFTDAHTASAVCTPTRYGLLTGRYPWRTRLKEGVLWPPAEPLIQPGRMTVASLLKRQGYYSAGIGKWHLGLDWTLQEGGHIDFGGPVTGGPTDLGFDHSFIIAGSLDMPPYAYVSNGRVVEAPTVEVPDSVFGRAGLAVEGLRPEDVLPRFTREAVNVIESHAAQRGDQPLFLYLPLNAPHRPVAPSARFQGATEMGAYGDFVHEVDWTVGRVVEALKEAGMYDNTLMVFTADNGTSPNAARSAMKKGHDVNGPLRGMKTTVWEGGHRVPYVAVWPGRIPSGTVNRETISLNDLMATAAALTGAELPAAAGVDSYNILPALLGRPHEKPIRDFTVAQSGGGYFAVRYGHWKLNLVAGSGGWAGTPGTERAREMGRPGVQLYDLQKDIAEQNNLQADKAEVVGEIQAMLLRAIERGRSTPGPQQQNWQGKNRWKHVNWLERD